MGDGIQTVSQTEHRSTGEIVQDILNNIGELVRSEIVLAKTEVRDEAKKASKAGGLFAAAGLLAFYGMAAWIATCMILIAMVTPLWFAVFIMGVVLFVASGIVLVAAVQKWRELRPPERTIQTVKEDVQWAKQQIK
jgi:uncharacterized membrane protein YqjE